MSKANVTRLFVGAIMAVVVGIVIAIATVVVALADGVVAFGGPDVVTVDGDALPGSLTWLAIAALFIVGGEVAALASWAGALLNTVRLDDKTWFIVLLVLGLFSLGWVAMVAYLIAGPDGKREIATESRIGTAVQI